MDTKVLEVCLRLRNDPSLAPFLDWLKAEREAVRTRLETLSTTHVQTAQGEAQRLADIINKIEDAPKLFERQKR